MFAKVYGALEIVGVIIIIIIKDPTTH